MSEKPVSVICCRREALLDWRRQVSSCTHEVNICRWCRSSEYVSTSAVKSRGFPIYGDARSWHCDGDELGTQSLTTGEEPGQRLLRWTKLGSEIGTLHVDEGHLQSRVEFVMCLGHSFFLEFCFGWIIRHPPSEVLPKYCGQNYGIRLSHIFEIFSISNEKPSVSK